VGITDYHPTHLVGSAVSVQGHRHPAVLSVLMGQGQARPQGSLQPAPAADGHAGNCAALFAWREAEWSAGHMPHLLLTSTCSLQPASCRPPPASCYLSLSGRAPMWHACQRQRQAGTHLCPHNALPPKEVVLPEVHVHGAALALRYNERAGRRYRWGGAVHQERPTWLYSSALAPSHPATPASEPLANLPASGSRP